MSVATDTLEVILGHLTGPKRGHEDQTAFAIRMVRHDTIQMALQDVRNEETKAGGVFVKIECPRCVGDGTIENPYGWCSDPGCCGDQYVECPDCEGTGKILSE